MNRMRPKALFTPTIFYTTGLLILVVLASLFFGAGDVSFSDILASFIGKGSAEANFVLYELRGPRTIIGLATGMALGVAGTLMQTLARNPLAEPGLLGISAGSSFAVTLALLLGASSTTLSVHIAQLGALGGSLLALSAARLGGAQNDPIRLVLAGATLSSLLLALTSLMLMFDQRSADEIRFWITGSVAGRDLMYLKAILPSFLAAALLTLWLARPLATLALGEQIAISLGHKPNRIRFIAVIIVALLVGSATALAGPIVFVGLVVPFIARALVGADVRKTLGLCLLIGPIVVLCADTVARLIIAPSELPLGVLTALMGAPVLLIIVRAQRLTAL